MSDSFCRVDTFLTETVCEFIATVESRLADSFLSRGYGHDVFLSDSLRVLAATSKRFYSARNCRQFQDKMAKREWSRDEIEEIIVEYEGRPSLWDVCSPEYRDRNKKTEAWTTLAVKLDREIGEVQRKIHNLRNQFCQEFKGGYPLASFLAQVHCLTVSVAWTPPRQKLSASL